MGREEILEYIEYWRRATRDSSRTTLVPRKGPRISESAVLESLQDEKAHERHGQVREVEKPESRSSVRGDQLVWVFGSPRTGSTWLSKIMAELDDQQRWNEPYVGLLFGSFIHERLDGASKLRSNPAFILSERYKDTWLESVKSFVLQGASARYPDLADEEYLIIKEPNGSVGASMLMEAMPESRMVFLMRDPRDVIASRLDAVGRGGWTGQERELGTKEELEAFTKHLAEDYLRSVTQVKEAYDSHSGRKAFLRYEELREETFEVMSRMYEELGIEVDDIQLRGAVSKHSWEAIPEEEKGEGKFYRKARPEGWREDLSAAQIEIIERVTAPVLERYYLHDGPSAQTLSG